MTAYRNCEVSEVMPVTLPSGVAGAGYGFSIRSENKRPLVTLSFATREDGRAGTGRGGGGGRKGR